MDDPLALVVAARPDLVAALTGATDADGLARLLDDWCAAHLGSTVAAVRWAEASMGLVIGVDLTDGHRLVVKVRPADAVRIGESRALQTALAADGLPVPPPVGGLHPLGPGLAGAEVRVDDVAPISRTEVDRMAALLHDLTAAATRLCPPGLALHAPWGIALAADRLWPDPPHDPRFDLTVAAPGADAIDAAGAEARRVLRAIDLPSVVGHVDWRAEHVLVDGAGAVAAVVDWDALVRAPEAVVVGQAAVGWTIVWGRPDPHPTVAEVAAFVAASEQARGAPFTEDERTALAAAGRYVVAYGARCELSDEVTGRGASGARGWRTLLGALGTSS